MAVARIGLQARVTALFLFTVTSALGQSSAIQGGGGADLAGGISTELSKHNAGSGCSISRLGSVSCVAFGPYQPGGDDPGAAALLNDDFTCDLNAVTGANGGACSGTAGAPGNTVDYAVLDIPLTASQISAWANAPFGQGAARNLIQIPYAGGAASIVIRNSAITGNGQATLSDADLCGIFSGQITDGGQINDSATPLSPGPISVFVRSGDAGPTLWLTAHLAAVCTGRTKGVFQPTANFQSLFPGGLPGNFVLAASQNDEAATLAGCAGNAPNSAIGYLTPDLTSLAPESNTLITCPTGQMIRSPLLAAGIISGGHVTVPTGTNIIDGLNHATKGNHLTPPQSAEAAADPANWAPLIEMVSEGYPIVGYALIDLAQCYADPPAGLTLRSLLKDVYAQPGYAKIEMANLWAPLSTLNLTGFYPAVSSIILGNAEHWGLNLQNTKACAGHMGR